tara:strand:- start:131 stop:1324 length:1194 start_codon:yes stop_codon:yes gene_type:complete
VSLRFFLALLLSGFVIACSPENESEITASDKEQTTTPISDPTPMPTPAPSPTPTPTPEPTPTPIPNCVKELPTRALLGQVVMTLAYPEDFNTVQELSIKNELGIMGILGSPSKQELEDLQDALSAISPPLLIASDEEGGRVQRLKVELGRLPSAAELAAMPLEEIEKMFFEYGKGLSNLGISIALAPVVDVGRGPGIGDRSFSNDPQSVIRNAGAVIAGYEQAGIIPVLKHFPGHGSASQDSHLGLASTPNIDLMRQIDLLPYQVLLKDSLIVMVGHLLVPGLTEDLPASLSSVAVEDLLRDELGFNGLIISDSLGMGAISEQWSLLEASTMALNAGVNVVMISDPEQVSLLLDGMESSLAIGELDKEKVFNSVEKVLSLKSIEPCQLVRDLQNKIN